ncbi:ricin-type beta-trefoil lectin domain protein [Saccharothrix sp. NRRL B-16348]|uniref:ricin-type beta-trefoil lectin domain protein n=1 Tax=Saccharothrix sp. NRRL B-16348 TaxID=1415542 RepID=UPI0006AF573B|nr:ricin-type beta-trefoil lectin domain protein [Saccharothrix sp. NRRL B-16348]
MSSSPTRRRRLTRVVAAVGCALGVAGLLTATASPAGASTSQFKGVNWADPRDNYAADEVVPSGLSKSDSYATTRAKATAVIGQFQAKLGANTVRLPVNPATVNGPFWASYTGAIDAAAAKGFKVILGYWEASTAKDGRIDDTAAFNAMWDRITAKYAAGGAVYFEPMNEPFGYSSQEWRDVAANWLAARPSVPRNRVFIGGTGYSEDVKPVCADSRLDGTYLALHQYGFWHKDWTSPQQWADDLRARIGNCASRTVLDEFGAEMTSGLNYNGAVNGSYEVAYIQAATDTLRSLGMGSVYWPGLRTGDSYSLTTLGGSGTDLTLNVTNASGADRLRWAWGGGTAPTPTGGVLRGAGSNRCLDVPGASRDNGTAPTLWDCNGGANQQWAHTAARELRVYGAKCLDADGAGTAARLIIRDCDGGTDQKWTFQSNGTVTNDQSGLCLDVTGEATANGSAVGFWHCNGKPNQVWRRG